MSCAVGEILAHLFVCGIRLGEQFVGHGPSAGLFELWDKCLGQRNIAGQCGLGKVGFSDRFVDFAGRQQATSPGLVDAEREIEIVAGLAHIPVRIQATEQLSLPVCGGGKFVGAARGSSNAKSISFRPSLAPNPSSLSGVAVSCVHTLS